ncbi:MAG: InlB B-repeat-containing protein [Treponema sp.]|nr:InlB B-repeat-containing protein [Treponema sp.]
MRKSIERMKKGFMILAAVFVIMGMFSIVSCGGGSDDSSGNNNSGQQQPNNPPENPPTPDNPPTPNTPITGTITITYNANDGTESPATSVKEYDSADGSITLASADGLGFSKDGATFAGWAQSATGDLYYNDSEYGITVLTHELPSNTFSLYAVWKIKVTFDGNGWTNPSNDSTTEEQLFATGVATPLPTVNWERNGYTLAGWSTDKNATEPAYKLDDKFTATTATTLYAVWQISISVGNIVLKDGTIKSYSDYTEDSENPAIGVIAFFKTDNGDTKWYASGDEGKQEGVKSQAYIIGLKSEELAWATADSTYYKGLGDKNSYTVNTSGIADDMTCLPTASLTEPNGYSLVKNAANKSGTMRLSDIKTFNVEHNTNADGSLVLPWLKKLLACYSSYGGDDTGTSGHYPAFDFANNYGTTIGVTEGSFSSGWYIPSCAELVYVYRNAYLIERAMRKIAGTDAFDETISLGAKAYSVTTASDNNYNHDDNKPKMPQHLICSKSSSDEYAALVEYCTEKWNVHVIHKLGE